MDSGEQRRTDGDCIGVDRMNTKLMKIIRDEEERNEHKWKAYTLKEGKQLLDDAVAYQKYWNEEEKSEWPAWKHEDNHYANQMKKREKITVRIGYLFVSACMEVSLTQAKKLAAEMWEAAESHLRCDHITGGHPYMEVNVGRYSTRFTVDYEGETHANQHIFDKCQEFKDELFRQQEEE